MSENQHGTEEIGETRCAPSVWPPQTQRPPHPTVPIDDQGQRSVSAARLVFCIVGPPGRRDEDSGSGSVCFIASGSNLVV